MVGIKFCECLFIVCHSGRAIIFYSISMSHAWRPPSHIFLVCLTRWHIMRLAALEYGLAVTEININFDQTESIETRK